MIDSKILEMSRNLVDPDFVKNFANDPSNANPDPVMPPAPHWGDLSLASGYPSFILFFSELNRLTGIDIDQIVFRYVQKMGESIESHGVSNISMFAGVAGVCFSLEQASQNGARYQKLLKKLDSHLVLKTRKSKIAPILEGIKKNSAIDSYLYDPISGICGIGRYLIEHLEKPEFYDVSLEIIEALILLCRPIEIQGKKVPGWFLGPNDNTNWMHKSESFKGNFNLGLAHGITGVLAFLSIASLRGIDAPYLKETISELSSWIESKCQTQNSIAFWPNTIEFDQEVKGISPQIKPVKDAWCYGALGISRTLYLAGKALNCKKTKERALLAFRGIFLKPQEGWGLPGPCLCHGLSGLMVITHEMSKTEEGKDLKLHVQKLKEIILSYLEPEQMFGFRDVESSKSGQVKVARLGFLDGVVGVFLSLLSVSSDLPSSSNWLLPMMIHE